MQARWQRGKVPRDAKFFSLTTNYTVYKITSKTSDKISLQQDDSALQLESHLTNGPWHAKVQDPKHLQQKISVKQRIPHRWDPTNHS